MKIKILLILFIVLTVFSACSTQNSNSIPESSITPAEKKETSIDEEQTGIPEDKFFLNGCTLNFDNTQEVNYEDEEVIINFKIPADWTYDIISIDDPYLSTIRIFNQNQEESFSFERYKVHGFMSHQIDMERKYVETQTTINDKTFFLFSYDSDNVTYTRIVPDYKTKYSFLYNSNYNEETKQVLYNCLASLEVQEK